MIGRLVKEQGAVPRALGLTSDVVGVREREGRVAGEPLEDVDLFVDRVPDEMQGKVVEDAGLEGHVSRGATQTSHCSPPT